MVGFGKVKLTVTTRDSSSWLTRNRLPNSSITSSHAAAEGSDSSISGSGLAMPTLASHRSGSFATIASARDSSRVSSGGWPAPGRLRSVGSRTRSRSATTSATCCRDLMMRTCVAMTARSLARLLDGAGPSAIGEGWLSISIWVVAVYCGIASQRQHGRGGGPERRDQQDQPMAAPQQQQDVPQVTARPVCVPWALGVFSETSGNTSRIALRPRLRRAAPLCDAPRLPPLRPQPQI